MHGNEMSFRHRREPYCIAWLARCREIGGKLSVWREDGFNGLWGHFPQEMQRGLGIVLTVCIGGVSIKSFTVRSGAFYQHGYTYSPVHCYTTAGACLYQHISTGRVHKHTRCMVQSVTQLQGLAYTNTSLLEGCINLPDVWFNLSVGPLCPDTEELVEPAEQICCSTQEYHHYSDSSSSNQW